MKCPKCGNDEDKVLDSRSVREGAAIRRRRECTTCGCRFTTHEEIDRDEVSVVKRDGRRQPFDRRKLEKGVRIACGNRPVSDNQIRNLLDVATSKEREKTRINKIEIIFFMIYTSLNIINLSFLVIMPLFTSLSNAR